MIRGPVGGLPVDFNHSVDIFPDPIVGLWSAAVGLAELMKVDTAHPAETLRQCENHQPPASKGCRRLIRSNHRSTPLRRCRRNHIRCRIALSLTKGPVTKFERTGVRERVASSQSVALDEIFLDREVRSQVLFFIDRIRYLQNLKISPTPNGFRLLAAKLLCPRLWKSAALTQTVTIPIRSIRPPFCNGKC